MVDRPAIVDPDLSGAEVKAYVISLPQAEEAYRKYNLPMERVKVFGNNGLVNPPLDMGKLAAFYNESTWHRNAVRVKARDVVGHDWSLEEEFTEGEEPQDAAQEKEDLDNFFWKL